MHKILCELSPQSWLIQDLTLFLTWNGTLASPAACVFHFNLLEIIWCIFQIYSAHWESRFAQLASCCVLKYIFIIELISLCCSNIQQGFIFPQLWARLVLTPGIGITSMDSLVKARKQRGQIAQARELSEANRISIIFFDSYGVCSISTAEDFKKKKKKKRIFWISQSGLVWQQQVSWWVLLPLCHGIDKSALAAWRWRVSLPFCTLLVLYWLVCCKLQTHVCTCAFL